MSFEVFTSFLKQNSITNNNNRWKIPTNSSCFFFDPSTEYEIIDVVKGLKNINGTGFDDINVAFLKKINRFHRQTENAFTFKKNLNQAL